MLPFFIGAVDPQHLSRRRALDRVRDELRAVQRALGRLEATQAVADADANALFAQARQVGLLTDDVPADPDGVVARLRDVLQTRADVDRTATGGAYARALARRRELRRWLQRVQVQLESLRRVAASRPSTARSSSCRPSASPR